MPKLNLSKEELNNILADYNSGISLAKICEKYHHHRTTLIKYFQEHGIKVRTKGESLRCSQAKKDADMAKRKYTVNENYFSSQNAKMAYFLGFLMADGNVAKKNNRIQVCLSEQDSDFLEIFYNEIGGSPVAHYSYHGNKEQICRWECISSKIKKDLINYDVIPNKTGHAKIPEKLDKQFYPDFIRGYFDGDGSVWVEKKSGAVGFRIVSHNPEILEQIITYFEENGIPQVRINIDNRHNTNYYFKYRKRSSKLIYNLLYYNKECLYMKRKFDKFTEIILKI